MMVSCPVDIETLLCHQMIDFWQLRESFQRPLLGILQSSIVFGEFCMGMNGMGEGQRENEGDRIGKGEFLSLPCNPHKVKPVTLSLGIQSSERMSNRKRGNECIECHDASIDHTVLNVWRDQSLEMHCLPMMSERENIFFLELNFYFQILLDLKKILYKYFKIVLN